MAVIEIRKYENMYRNNPKKAKKRIINQRINNVNAAWRIHNEAIMKWKKSENQNESWRRYGVKAASE